jgi:hypothetical protein
MNWLTLYKLAVVMEERPQFDGHSGYMGLGHCRFDGSDCPQNLEIEELWVIDQQFQLTAYPTAEERTHRQVWDTGYWSRSVAKGRYTKDERFPDGACSVVMTAGNGYLQELNPRKYEYIHGKVVAILEQHYGPKVHLYFY